MESVIILSDSDRSLYFDDEKQIWLVKVHSKIYKIGDDGDQSVIAILPFLELSIRDFQENFSKLFENNLELNFPYEIFVRAGFIHGSPHWIDCSLRWLTELDELDADFSEELGRVVSNTRRYSQKSRQLAKKLMKRRASNYSAASGS